jgi:hypothetical protein
VAKLKRAASLPRTPAGRRPSTRQAVNDDAQGAQDTAPLTTDLNQPGPSTYQHSQAGQDTQEMLSPSPINSSFDHNAIYAHAQALQMQRSATSSWNVSRSSVLPGITFPCRYSRLGGYAARSIIPPFAVTRSCRRKPLHRWSHGCAGTGTKHAESSADFGRVEDVAALQFECGEGSCDVQVDGREGHAVRRGSF